MEVVEILVEEAEERLVRIGAGVPLLRRRLRPGEDVLAVAPAQDLRLA
jgi:hypothetical protein